MTRCSHDVPLEHKCDQCTSEGLDKVSGEHLRTDRVEECNFYPDHDDRIESATFRKTKRDDKKRGMRCAITGQQVDLEWHHATLEWAFGDAVRLDLVRDIALGKVKELPVLDPYTWEPTGEMAPVEGFLIYWIVLFFKWRGFDFEAWDPSDAEAFIDSPQAMLVLHKHLHREKHHGAHAITGPIFLLQAFPFVDGFVFSPDELEARHKLKE